MSTFFVKSLPHQRKDGRRRLDKQKQTHTLVEHRNSPPRKHSATRQPSVPRLKPWEIVSPTGGALSLEGKGLPGTAYYTGREECGDCPTAACTQRHGGPTCARLLYGALLPTLLSYLSMVAILTGVRLISV